MNPNAFPMKFKVVSVIKAVHILLVLFILLFPTVCTFAQSPSTAKLIKQGIPDKLENGFHHPPDQAKPQVWWHWMNGNITKAGITADLEAMKTDRGRRCAGVPGDQLDPERAGGFYEPDLAGSDAFRYRRSRQA